MSGATENPQTREVGPERREARGPRRVLSLIIFAQSNDLVIPDDVIRRLLTTIYGH